MENYHSIRKRPGEQMRLAEMTVQGLLAVVLFLAVIRNLLFINWLEINMENNKYLFHFWKTCYLGTRSMLHSATNVATAPTVANSSASDTSDTSTPASPASTASRSHS